MNIKDFHQQFPPPDWPEFLDAKVSATSCVLTINVGSGVRWFEGHFPDQPILAGVVQAHWAVELGKFIFDIHHYVVRIDNLKFQSVILPDQTLQLTLDYFPDTYVLKFSYRTNELHFSEGKFLFQPQSNVLTQQYQEAME
jgi:hypothetical protein